MMSLLWLIEEITARQISIRGIQMTANEISFIAVSYIAFGKKRAGSQGAATKKQNQETNEIINKLVDQQSKRDVSS